MKYQCKVALNCLSSFPVTSQSVNRLGCEYSYACGCKPLSAHHLVGCPLWARDDARLKSLQNSGAFRELFWVLLTKTEKFCAIFKKFGSFSGAFLGAFDKYVEILCYFWEPFQRFGSIRKLFGAFSWKLPNSGHLPKFGSRRHL